MERQGTVTVDVTILTIIILMMATTAHLILFWHGHFTEHRETMSDYTLSFFTEYLFRKLVYFSVLWWLLTKTITVRIPEPGGESAGPVWDHDFLKNS